jgi:2-keto-4-pentenoate hydratase/2-oxohepta-3-ene-1,7-dioic acid hydratase in catechol pathway
VAPLHARDGYELELGIVIGSAGRDLTPETALDALDADALAMTARVNGETWSEGSTSTLLWSIAELVAWASTGEPLAAGTLLGSGTVGRGCGLELRRTLEPGDVVELEIEGLGVLRNRLGTPPPSGWHPEPRERTT